MSTKSNAITVASDYSGSFPSPSSVAETLNKMKLNESSGKKSDFSHDSEDLLRSEGKGGDSQSSSNKILEYELNLARKKEKKAKILIEELRQSLQRSLQENDESTKEMLGLLHKCERLNCQNKILQHENETLQVAYHKTAAMLKKLSKQVGKKSFEWEQLFQKKQSRWEKDRLRLEKQILTLQQKIVQMEKKEDENDNRIRKLSLDKSNYINKETKMKKCTQCHDFYFSQCICSPSNYNDKRTRLTPEKSTTKNPKQNLYLRGICLSSGSSIGIEADDMNGSKSPSKDWTVYDIVNSDTEQSGGHSNEDISSTDDNIHSQLSWSGTSSKVTTTESFRYDWEERDKGDTSKSSSSTVSPKGNNYSTIGDKRQGSGEKNTSKSKERDWTVYESVHSDTELLEESYSKTTKSSPADGMNLQSKISDSVTSSLSRSAGSVFSGCKSQGTKSQAISKRISQKKINKRGISTDRKTSASDHNRFKDGKEIQIPQSDTQDRSITYDCMRQQLTLLKQLSNQLSVEAKSIPQSTSSRTNSSKANDS